jgi:hypothetical protein
MRSILSFILHCETDEPWKSKLLFQLDDGDDEEWIELYIIAESRARRTFTKVTKWVKFVSSVEDGMEMERRIVNEMRVPSPIS